MKIRDLTMSATQAEILRQECNVAGPLEGACQFLVGVSVVSNDPWSTEDSSELRLTIHRLDPIPSAKTSSSETRVSWDMDYYVKLLRRARDGDLHPGICHSHPNSTSTFSKQDDENESHLLDIVRRRNGSQLLTSLLFRGDETIEARVWTMEGATRVPSVRILGKTICEFNASSLNYTCASNHHYLHRQRLIVGEETMERLQSLRVAVVGCGGTGSAVAVLLARTGIGRILLIDPEPVDETNLNRLHGATRRDAEKEKPKVYMLRDHIESMGLGTKVAVLQSHLASAETARVLVHCDCIFGCTDDHLGRLILNRLAYFYYIPVVDTGLAVDPIVNKRTAQITGRVTTLRPSVTCLLCRDTISPRRAREKSLLLKQPIEYKRQKKEGYIHDNDTPTPVVGTFTTETATAAVNEFLSGFANLRGNKGWAGERTIRYDIDKCRTTGCMPRPDCPVCASQGYWGLGDVEPFLDLSGL